MIILYKEGVFSLLAYQYRPIDVVLDDQDPDSGIPFTSDGAFLRLPRPPKNWLRISVATLSFQSWTMTLHTAINIAWLENW